MCVIVARKPHPRLRRPVFIESHPGRMPDIRKRPVMIIVIQKIRRRIASHINIRPTIQIKIAQSTK